MGIARRSLTTALYVLLVLTSSFAFAQQEPIATTSGNMTSVEWSVKASGHDRIELSVTGPEDFEYSKTFPAGKSPSFRINEHKMSDGTYNYELRLVPKISNDVKKALAAARADDNQAEIRRIQRANGLADPQVVQAGTFTMRSGSLVPMGGDEGAGGGASMASGESAGDTGSRGSGSANGKFTGLPVVNDQVIPDDLIVQSSICAGFDCVDGESFGVDTIRMKENNLRLHFDDTSTSAGFANNDWRLVANDQPSGGANKFSLEDSTAGRNPVTVEAAAPANALYVDSTGNIGFQQSAPGLDLHLTTTDTPALRLEQTSGGGFTAQTWDIGGNEANFFIRDLTGGSRLSLRIRPGAPTSSIDISSSGSVGVGTASPGETLHVFDNNTLNVIAAPQAIFQGRQGGWGAGIEMGSVLNGGTAYKTMAKIVSDGDSSWDGTAANQDARLGFFTTLDGTLTERLRITGAGAVTITGNLTVNGNSTVTGTKSFAHVDPADSNKMLYYVSLEGPEAGTYFRGTAKTVNGVATIELPGYFSRITESERMTVQLTPVGSWGNLYVASKTPQQLVIKVPEGANDLEFDYLVQGVRKGYLDFQVERENDIPTLK